MLVRKDIHLTHERKKYSNKDNVRLKIILFLYSQGKSNAYAMTKDSKSNITGQKWLEFSNRLHELVEWNLVEKKQSEDAANVKVYSLTTRGREIAELILSLEEKFPELWKLESFKDVRRID